MKARYIRVSTLNQNIERQLKNQHSDEILYIDKVTGSAPFIERPQAYKLIKDILDRKLHMSVYQALIDLDVTH